MSRAASLFRCSIRRSDLRGCGASVRTPARGRCWRERRGRRDLMLSSPIILYDYPQIAPESPGDLCDGTEIDEILALRILDHDRCREARSEERRRSGSADSRKNRDAAAGAFSETARRMRGLRASQGLAMNEWEWQLLEDKPPVESCMVNGVEYRVGDRVRLQSAQRRRHYGHRAGGEESGSSRASSRITRARCRSRS